MNHDTTANSPKESGTNATETSIPSHESRLGNNSLRPYRSGDFSRTMKRKASRISHHKAKREIRNAPWTPGDDYLLINSVVMVCNLTEVYHTVRFAVHFTEEEIERRWRDLLFDPIVSSTALKAIEQLPSFMKSQLDRQIPFSSQEDNIIAQISLSDVYPDGVFKSVDIHSLNPSIFTEILRKYPTVFYTGRDELDLYRQWCRFSNCHCIIVKDGVKLKSIPNYNASLSTSSDVKTTGTSVTAIKNRDSISLLKNVNYSNSIALGGDPQSFSDTELLLEETVTNAVFAGIPKLTEPSSVSRRQHMLNQTSYHGFQGLVTQTVLEVLLKEYSSQLNYSVVHPSSHHHSSPTAAASSSSPTTTTTSSTRGTTAAGLELKSSISHDQSHSPLMQETSNKSHLLSFISSSSVPPLLNNQDFDLKRRLELHRRRGRLWARLRRNKEEARRWTRLVEMCITNSLEIMDPQPAYPALASLTGSRTQFLIKERKVIFGRNSFVCQPHIDLSMEGIDSGRISRCHGQIRLSKDGIFWLANFSSHTVYVDGNPILTDEEVELKDFATILIDHITLRFDVNHDYVNWICSNYSTISTTTNNIAIYSCDDKSHTIDNNHYDGDKTLIII
uniref:MCRS_N domain-containing protein n=1 Tax=Schistosoma mansoni TaxID=6183 RepID=A0A5K4F3B2_SCHMA